MPQSKTRKKPQPRIAVPRADPLKQLRRTTEDCINLVRDLQPVLTEEQHVELRAGALGMLITYSILTGNPDPRELASIRKEHS